MSSIFLDASQNTNVTRTSEGNQRQVRGFRDGSTIAVDWYQALVAEGRVHTAGTGTGTTPTALNPVYGDALQDFYLFVPAGTIVIPLWISVALEDTGTILGIDTLAGYSANGDSAVTGTALTIHNYKTLASPASACTATAVVTSAGTTHLGGDDFAEFWRPYAGLIPDHFNAAAAVNITADSGPNGAHWSAREGIAPMIGSAGNACALSVFAGAQAGVGFLQVVWAELPASAFA